MPLKFPRLWRRRPKADQRSAVLSSSALDDQQQSRDIGLMLRQRREALGLTLRDLANETRITTPVIEALERSWTDRLPERAYLASMLPKLEQRLDLPAGCLDPVLPPRTSLHQVRSGRLRRFTPGSIDVFTTWQGSVVYAVAIAASLLALNRQQHELAQSNSLSLQPIPADIADLSRAAGSSDDPVVAALRPLEQVRSSSAEQWLQAVGSDAQGSIGVLQVILSQPRQLQVSSRGGDRLNLKGGAGNLTLQLLPPVQLTITPPPSAADRVLWNGQPQQPDAKTKGLYRVEAAPLPKPAAPASERPQTAPRSP
jgi:transcriptional regulator with XRE-family HTH domain